MEAVFNLPLVQSYLSAYAPQSQEQVVKATFLYGVLMLRQTAPLTVEGLEEKIRSALVAEDLVSSYKQQLTQMKAEIDKLDTQLSAQPRRVKSASPSKHLDFTLNTQWRKGDSAVFRGPEVTKAAKKSMLFRDQSPPALRDANYNIVMKDRDEFGPAPPKDYQDRIYPDWWKDLCSVHSMPTPVKRQVSKAQAKQVPSKDQSRALPKQHSRELHHRESRDMPMQHSRELPRESRVLPSRENRDYQRGPKPRKDVAVEADFSSESSSVEATPSRLEVERSEPWAMDYSNFIKSSPPVRDSPYSSQQASSKPSVYSQSSEDLRRPQSVHSTPLEPRLVASSQFSGSSMSAYHPSEEVRTFYRNEFPNLLESGGTQSGGSLGGSWRKAQAPEHSFSLKV
jgi:hypothetical protein